MLFAERLGLGAEQDQIGERGLRRLRERGTFPFPLSQLRADRQGQRGVADDHQSVEGMLPARVEDPVEQHRCGDLVDAERVTHPADRPALAGPVGIGPPPVLGLPGIVDPHHHPRRHVAAGRFRGVGDRAQLRGPAQVLRDVGRHGVEAPDLEGAARGEQAAEDLGLVQIDQDDPCPLITSGLDQGIAAVLDQDREGGAGLAVDTQPPQQRHRLIGQADQQHQRRRVADPDPVVLIAEQRGDDAQCGDDQQQRAQQAGELQGGWEGGRAGLAVGDVAADQVEREGQRCPQRTLIVGGFAGGVRDQAEEDRGGGQHPRDQHREIPRGTRPRPVVAAERAQAEEHLQQDGPP